ncbi:MAG: hypothetical protein QOG25_2146 [Acetobacteraceae bacterium]|nr:hypothetical protein [Acetobacteraceae bacterium]
MFGQPERLKPKLFGKDALANLIDQDLLRRGMHFRERAIVDRDPVLGEDHRKTGRAIMEDANLEHRTFLLRG